MAWSYKIFEDLHFSIQKYYGAITFDELYNMVKTYFEDAHFSSIDTLFIDGSGCSANFEPIEILRCSDLFEIYKDRNNHKKVVLMMVSPKEVVCAEILNWISSRSKREYCHTTAKAYILLDLPISYKEFLEKLNW